MGLNKRQRPPIRNSYAYRRSGVADISGKRHTTMKREVGNDHEKRELQENIHSMYGNFNKRQKPPHTLSSLLQQESVNGHIRGGRSSVSSDFSRNFKKRQPPGSMTHYDSAFDKRQRPASVNLV